VITALDVGTSKVAALIAEVGEDGAIRVLGSGQRACEGVKRGYIADREKAEIAIRQAVDQAERNAGVSVEGAWVGFSAGGLDSDVAHFDVDIGGHQVHQGDLNSVLEEARQNIDPGGRTILHAQPALYTLDDLQGVLNPLGLHANRLGVDIHIVTADTPPVQNLDLTVRHAHLGVESIVAAPLASGMACLSREERELGVALIEMGAGVTNVAVFAGGMLVGLSSIPVGGGDVTDDIASAFATRREHAERLKCFHGAATMTPSDNHAMVEVIGVSDEDGAEAGRATRAQLIAVIRQRLDLIVAEIGQRLIEMGFTGPGGRQVVLTGGGAELKGIADFAQGALGRAVRVGRPAGIIGLPETQGGAAFSCVAGLAIHAASGAADFRGAPGGEQTIVRASAGSIFGRLYAAFRNNL
jgi:cell division protein FtsA